MLMDIKIIFWIILNIWRVYNFENKNNVWYISKIYLLNRKVFVVNYFEDLLILILFKIIKYFNNRIL